MGTVIAHRDRLAPPIRARALLARAATVYGETINMNLPTAQEALMLFEQLGDIYGQARASLFIGLSHLRDNELAQAIATLQKAYDFSREVADPWLTSQAIITIGLAWACAGEYERSARCLEEGLATAQANHDTWNILLALFNSAMLAQSQGDIQRVAHFCRAYLSFSGLPNEHEALLDQLINFDTLDAHVLCVRIIPTAARDGVPCAVT